MSERKPEDDPFAALVEALERIAVLERQVKQLQQFNDRRLPEGVSSMWVPPLSSKGNKE